MRELSNKGFIGSRQPLTSLTRIGAQGISMVVALSNALWSRNTRDTEFKSFSSYRISSAGGFRFAGKIHDFKAFRKTRRREARQLDALTKKIDATIHKHRLPVGLGLVPVHKGLFFASVSTAWR